MAQDMAVSIEEMLTLAGAEDIEITREPLWNNRKDEHGPLDTRAGERRLEVRGHVVAAQDGHLLADPREPRLVEPPEMMVGVDHRGTYVP